jgi:hypothetical protein
MILAAGLLRAADDTAKVARYSERDLVPLKTKLRFTTLIIFPAGEQIEEVTIGDRDFWVIDGKDNLLHVKPTREGLRTNLNVVMRSKAIYSFLAQEVGQKEEPDLKVVMGLDETVRLRRENDDVKAQLKKAESELIEKTSAIAQERKQNEARRIAEIEILARDRPNRLIDLLKSQKFFYVCFSKMTICTAAAFTAVDSTIIVGRLGENPRFSGSDDKGVFQSVVPYTVDGNVYRLQTRVVNGDIWYGGKSLHFQLE